MNESPTTITIRVPARIANRWNAMISGRGWGDLKILVQGGTIVSASLNESFQIQPGELERKGT